LPKDPDTEFSNWLDHYAENGFGKVEGWVIPRVFQVLKAICTIQSELKTVGGAVEIGVHHGKFFLPLNAMVESVSETSLAIDVFERQDLNIEKSGWDHFSCRWFRSKQLWRPLRSS